jgi:hypothetical protein
MGEGIFPVGGGLAEKGLSRLGIVKRGQVLTGCSSNQFCQSDGEPLRSCRSNLWLRMEKS